MHGEWIPIVMFAAIGIVVGLFIYFRYRARREVQLTVRSVIESGQAMTPELLESLGEPPRPANSDLRRGVILMAVGAGFAAFGAVLGEEEAMLPLIAVGSFPFVVGLAYLGLWKFREK